MSRGAVELKNETLVIPNLDEISELSAICG